MTFLEADRAVSVTVTHILALAITTILISGLLLGAGSLLDSERHRSTQGSLETIGERLAGEIASVDRIDPQDGEVVSVTTNHPTLVTGSPYIVELRNDCNDLPLVENADNCLVLTDQDEDVEVAIPVRIDADVTGENQAKGGSIEIVLDGDEDEDEISLQDGDS